jgi:maleate isomerase
MQRLGIIIPSSNTTVEREFSNVLQGTDVSVHYARVHLNDVTIDGLERMEAELEDAARLLKDSDVDTVAFACTSGSLIKGLGYDALLAKRISEAAGCPAFTTSGAVVDALHTLNARKVSLATPYLEEVAEREVSFLEKNGFSVVRKQSLNIRENLRIGLLMPSDAEAIAEEVYSNKSDVIFVSCTNFRTFEVLSSLEQQLGKPVVSSNSAMLWAAMHALKINCLVSLGQLFDHLI